MNRIILLILLNSLNIIYSQDSGWINYNRINSELPHNWVSSIAIDLDGSNWAAIYDGGIARFDGNEWIVYNIKYPYVLMHYI